MPLDKECRDSSDDTQPFLPHDPSSRHSPAQKKTHSSTLLWVLLAISNLSWAIWSFFSIHTRLLNADLRRISTPSPLFNHINLGPYKATANGSNQDNGSIFRKPPSTTVDEAWSRIAFDSATLINVTAADIRASGKDPTTRVRWDDAVDSYPAQIEFAHKIHCLDTLRREIWSEHYHADVSIRADDAAIARGEYDQRDNEGLYVDGNPRNISIKGQRRQHRDHVMHCLDMLRQDLMCNVDVGIVTHVWVTTPGLDNGPYYPFPDFSAEKQCRDFDATADWTMQNAVQNGEEKFMGLGGRTEPVVASTGSDNYFPHGFTVAGTEGSLL